MHYLMTHLSTAWTLTVIHLRLSLIPVLIGLAIALPLGVLVQRTTVLRRLTTVTTSVVFTIPSLALFVVLPLIIPTRILDEANVVVALTLYTTALLVRAVLEALDAVPAHVRDAATAVGHNAIRRMLKVELPLAIPVLVSGLRVVVVTNISMVSVGAVIGIGGLGTWFTEGYQANKSDQIVAGIIAIFVLAVALDVLIMLAGRLATPWERAARRAVDARSGHRSSAVRDDLPDPGVGLPLHVGQLARAGRVGRPHTRASGVHRCGGRGFGGDRDPDRAGHRTHRSRHDRRGRHRQWAARPADARGVAAGCVVVGAGPGATDRRVDAAGHPAAAGQHVRRCGQRRPHGGRRRSRHGDDRDPAVVARGGAQRAAAHYRRVTHRDASGGRHRDGGRLRQSGRAGSLPDRRDQSAPVSHRGGWCADGGRAGADSRCGAGICGVAVCAGYRQDQQTSGQRPARLASRAP
ncbi:binding--dependent transport system inner membrane component family protein [Mycobacterium xenopi 3993]|nr:binding--dependent transport system inner membrane component family protein [Mycobacterium xenopi 3993]